MLALGRVLARRPRMLIGDEMSLGLAPLVVERLFGAVQTAARETGLGVLLAERHVSEALRFADRGYVMNRGRTVLEGTAQELEGRLQEIEDVYFGLHEDAVAPS